MNTEREEFERPPPAGSDIEYGALSPGDVANGSGEGVISAST